MNVGLMLHRITDPRDPILPDWLDLYQYKFPLSEQVLVSTFLHALNAESEASLRLLAILRENRLVGMACWELCAEAKTGYLWYLAAEPEGQGIGSWTYRQILRQLETEAPDAVALVFEVERPEDAHDEETRVQATRRIAFYETKGALLCGGIEYSQDVGWQPPVPMHLMIHPLPGIDLNEQWAADILAGVFGEAVQGVDKLALLRS